MAHPVSRRRRQVRKTIHGPDYADETTSGWTDPIPTARDDIYTINQLNLPVDKPVPRVPLDPRRPSIASGLSSMRVKQDAIPGMEIPVWWVPTVTGEYEINCSQLCGLGHYRMRGFMNIQTEGRVSIVAR